MKKFAIISDIHGNLPALNAVLKNIDRHQVDYIYCLGDLIGKGPNSVEVIDICKTACHQIIKGNWDKFLASDLENEGATWYRNQIGKERLDYLNNLPEFIEFYLSGKCFRLIHAHPHDVYKRIHPTSPLEERVVMFEPPTIIGKHNYDNQSDIVGYGDIHSSFIQNLPDGKTLFNVGSVGNSCDHTPLASYVIIEGIYNSRTLAPYSIQFYKVPYDNELAIQHAQAIDLPNKEAYINEIKTAVYSR